MRCEMHGLAAGPDGRCALCHRTEHPSDPAPRAGPLVPLLLTVTALASAAYFARDSLFPQSAEQGSVMPLSPETPPAAARDAVAAPSAGPGRAGERDPLPPLPSSPSPASTSGALGVAAAGTAVVPEAAAGSAAAPPPSADPRPSSEEITKALRETDIVMFSTTWCGVCARARAFFAANGLSYQERDIERDASARDELKRRTGRSAIPTLVIDGEQLEPGFSEGAVTGALSASLRRRLGVADLHLQRQR